MDINAVLEQLESDFDDSVDRLCAWLAIPSVSTDPDRADDCRRAAQWLADQLAGLGFTAELRPTGGHPVVFAHHPGPDDERSAGPHILFYGHYDVQPPDPLDLWDSPPFEPTIVDGPRGKRIVARGAVDDKGQVMMFVEALRAHHAVSGTIPCRITCIIEGEEEVGSENLPKFVASIREELVGSDCPGGSPCDVVLVSDTAMWDINTPALTVGLRGLCYREVVLRGPDRDVHSGHFGGAIPNPINELTRILGRLHDDDGRVAIPGFYDDVVPLTDAERAEWAQLDFNSAAALARIGLSAGKGEKGYTMLEREWGRPACDINGIKGGYIGRGAKTIIASSASAKVSFRLVPNQDPVTIGKAFCQWFDSHVPNGCRTEFLEHGDGHAYLAPADSRYMTAARTSLRTAVGAEPVLIRAGGSIPIINSFKKTLGLDSILMGFGLDDDRVHSPNEKFELKCFSFGRRSHAILLAQLAGRD